jgi:hypothetical protein
MPNRLAMNDTDRKLKDAIITWLYDSDAWYDSREMQREDLLELVQDWCDQFATDN